MNEELIVSIIVILGGLFSMTAAVMNWEWYMNHRKAQFMIKILSRNGARIFYFCLGLGLVGIGIRLVLVGR